MRRNGGTTRRNIELYLESKKTPQYGGNVANGWMVLVQQTKSYGLEAVSVRKKTF